MKQHRLCFDCLIQLETALAKVAATSVAAVITMHYYSERERSLRPSTPVEDNTPISAVVVVRLPVRPPNTPRVPMTVLPLHPLAVIRGSAGYNWIQVLCYLSCPQSLPAH